MKWTFTATVIAAALVAGSAQAGSNTTVTIRHQVRGCHSWAVNGGTYKASQAVRIAGGSTIRFTNNDVMPHMLVKTQGPAIQMLHANMNHMSATATVTFTKAGVYKFTTKPGEDYMKGMKTIGKDNVLRLTVHVS